MIKALILCGPSGSGKSTLCKHLLKHIKKLHFSISACSRPPRQGEKNGIDYHFIDTDAFQKKIQEKAFLEYEEVYPGRFYGTLNSEFEKATAQGKVLLFDIDIKGGITLKQKIMQASLTIFIAPPSITILRERLLERKTESSTSIAQRIEKATYELSFQSEFDHVVVNDELERSKQEVLHYVQKRL